MNLTNEPKQNLADRVQTLINEIEATRRYSMIRIYALYNETFDTDEKPQSCASCLIKKIRELKTWLDANTPKPTADAPQTKTTPKRRKNGDTKKE